MDASTRPARAGSGPRGWRLDLASDRQGPVRYIPTRRERNPRRPAWEQAAPLEDFAQAEPLEGQPASERTEVRLLYDDTAIYVGVVLHDTDPSQIVTTDTRRDAGLGDRTRSR